MLRRGLVPYFDLFVVAASDELVLVERQDLPNDARMSFIDANVASDVVVLEVASIFIDEALL